MTFEVDRHTNYFTSAWTGLAEAGIIVKSNYQPSKAELEEDMLVDASFDEAVDALTQPVRIRYIDRPKLRG